MRMLFHPECPGTRIRVVRGFWGRLFKPRHFATLTEVKVYRLHCDLRYREESLLKTYFDMGCG